MLLGPLIGNTTDNLDDILNGKIVPSWGDSLDAGANFLMNMPAIETDKYKDINKSHLEFSQANQNLKVGNIANLVRDIADDYSVVVQGVLNSDQIASLYQETVLPARQEKFIKEISKEGKLDVDKTKFYAWNLYENAVEKDGDGNYTAHAGAAAKAIGYAALSA